MEMATTWDERLWNVPKPEAIGWQEDDPGCVFLWRLESDAVIGMTWHPYSDISEVSGIDHLLRPALNCLFRDRIRFVSMCVAWFLRNKRNDNKQTEVRCQTAPERQLVQKVSEEWTQHGIVCVGARKCDEIALRARDGSIRFVDMEITKDGRIGVVEFKVDCREFMQACGQVIGYAARMYGGNTESNNYFGNASLFVVTPEAPSPYDVMTALRMYPPVNAWWPGCPPPL